MIQSETISVNVLPGIIAEEWGFLPYKVRTNEMSVVYPARTLLTLTCLNCDHEFKMTLNQALGLRNRGYYCPHCYGSHNAQALKISPGEVEEQNPEYKRELDSEPSIMMWIDNRYGYQPYNFVSINTGKSVRVRHKACHTLFTTCPSFLEANERLQDKYTGEMMTMPFCPKCTESLVNHGVNYGGTRLVEKLHDYYESQNVELPYVFAEDDIYRYRALDADLAVTCKYCNNRFAEKPENLFARVENGTSLCPICRGRGKSTDDSVQDSVQKAAQESLKEYKEQRETESAVVDPIVEESPVETQVVNESSVVKVEGPKAVEINGSFEDKLEKLVEEEIEINQNEDLVDKLPPVPEDYMPAQSDVNFEKHFEEPQETSILDEVQLTEEDLAVALGENTEEAEIEQRDEELGEGLVETTEEEEVETTSDAQNATDDSGEILEEAGQIADEVTVEEIPEDQPMIKDTTPIPPPPQITTQQEPEQEVETEPEVAVSIPVEVLEQVEDEEISSEDLPNYTQQINAEDMPVEYTPKDTPAEEIPYANPTAVPEVQAEYDAMKDEIATEGIEPKEETPEEFAESFSEIADDLGIYDKQESSPEEEHVMIPVEPEETLVDDTGEIIIPESKDNEIEETSQSVTPTDEDMPRSAAPNAIPNYLTDIGDPIPMPPGYNDQFKNQSQLVPPQSQPQNQIHIINLSDSAPSFDHFKATPINEILDRGGIYYDASWIKDEDW